MHAHPVMERWTAEETGSVDGTNGAMKVFSGGDFPVTSGGFKIIFKNARITADRVIIEPIQPKQPGADK